MNWKPVIWIGALAAVGTGGYFAYRYFKQQAILLADYETELLNIKLPVVTKELVTIDFTIRIKNKSSIEATLKKLHADIYINNQNVGFVKNKQEFVIPAKGSNDLPFSLTFASKLVYDTAVGALISLIKSQDITYQLVGYVQLSSGGIGGSKDFKYNGSIKSALLG